MLSVDFLELALTVGTLIVCVSYMFLGCAGHKRRTGEESQNVDPSPDEQQQLNPSQVDQVEGSRAPEASKLSNVDQSIAGYQSQTSEILAGPGENLADGISTISRQSHASHAAASRVGSHHGSHLGSGMSSHHQGSHAGSHHGSSLGHAGSSAMQSSKFGSTLDSSVAASRAAGGGPASVLSVLSRAGASNIQSSLSSTPSIHSSTRPSNMGVSNLGSGITSNHQSGLNSNMDSSLQKSRASNIAHSLMSSAGKGRPGAMAGQSSGSIRNNPSVKTKSTSKSTRLLTSSVAVSASSPASGQSVVSPHTSGASSPRSESGSPMSGRSVTTPHSTSSRVSGKSK